ncbi:hypothetical protein [Naasia aerilata]|uniref:Uncharacterized protein n=1 Tax=Naasia aerilata TaxID=1162966 RepID=A0ABM8GG73_9MICO|nr:hypothetical protein [Naasia aerilata]BDZ47331.1 hypothetical protein GCM10025866_32400 [Naasia aerilata]
MPDVPRRWSGALEVVALSSHEWRVCDLHLDEDDGRRVLGYIEARDARYDVLELCPEPVRHGDCGSWEDALGLLYIHSRAGRGSGIRPANRNGA